jgi:hypothetical protein
MCLLAERILGISHHHVNSFFANPLKIGIFFATQRFRPSGRATGERVGSKRT